MEENGFRAIDYASFFGDGINCIGPEPSNELHNTMSAADDASMRAVVNRELKEPRLHRGTSPFQLF